MGTVQKKLRNIKYCCVINNDYTEMLLPYVYVSHNDRSITVFGSKDTSFLGPEFPHL